MLFLTNYLTHLICCSSRWVTMCLQGVVQRCLTCSLFCFLPLSLRLSSTQLRKSMKRSRRECLISTMRWDALFHPFVFPEASLTSSNLHSCGGSLSFLTYFPASSYIPHVPQSCSHPVRTARHSVCTLPFNPLSNFVNNVWVCSLLSCISVG